MYVNRYLPSLVVASAFVGAAFAAPRGISASPSTTPSSVNSTFCVSTPTDFYTQNSHWASFVNLFYIKKDITTAFHEYVVSNYIQHNPFIGQGAATAMQALNELLPPVNITILRYGMDKGLGWIHVKADGLSGIDQPTAIVDIYRWNGSCIVEHWDVIETRPQNATNPLALF